jgi:tRNA A58 N-methylase Trm61
LWHGHFSALDLFFPRQIFTRGGKTAILTGAKQGFMHVLQFTPERWTYALPHRTQILYFYDISTVVFQLNLRPGSKVIESGTGSGSLTNALARAVAPTGHVYTFEFNAERARKAQEEFKELKLTDFVTAKHGDACAGFGRELDDSVDAVFLDLPSPWLAIPHAYCSLKKSGASIICCFSPCIEQVQKNCIKLTTLGFEDVSTVEALGCEFDVSSVSTPQPNIPSLFAPSSTSSSSAGASKATSAGAQVGFKRRRDEDEGVDFVSAPAAGGDNDEDDEEDGSIEVPLYPSQLQGPLPLATRQYGAGVAGHSGYLTFATLYRKKLSNEDVLAGKVLVDESAVADLINRKSKSSSEAAGSSSSSSSSLSAAAAGKTATKEEQDGAR